MNRSEIAEFVREVINTGSSFSAEGVESQVRRITERWVEDARADWAAGVEGGARLGAAPATVRRVFTFGPASAKIHWPDHRTRYGTDLAVVMEGETANHCLAAMLNRFGREWAFSYAEDEARREMPYLTYVPESDWPAETYPAGKFSVEIQYQLIGEAVGDVESPRVTGI